MLCFTRKPAAGYNYPMKDSAWERLQVVYLLALGALLIMILGCLGQDKISALDVLSVFAVEAVIFGFGVFVAKAR